jgi:hypothetical protein
MRRLTAVVIAEMGVVLLAATVAAASGLKPATRQAYEKYRESTEARIGVELAGGGFMSFERLPAAEQEEIKARLRHGEVVIERVAARAGHSIHPAGGLIHDWLATVFIPNATLEDALRLAQDYDHHQRSFAPEVEQSRLLMHSGDDFKIFYRLRRTKVITVVLNTEHDVRYTRVDATHAYSRSSSTRIAEIEHPGDADERELPAGEDHGFLWQLDSYWRFEQADGGVYLQCEAISLTRDIPTGLGWMVGPFVEKIPRESLAATMQNERKGVQQMVAGTRR